MALISAIKQVLPENQIKLCLWHFYRNIEIKRKKIYGDKLNQNQDSLNIVKRIKTLPYIDPNYVKPVLDIISLDAINAREEDNKFVNEYFKKTYIKTYDINDYNYYKIYDHRTNNACMSYNHILNSKFNRKPTIWKFINIIRNEENNLRIEINNIKKYIMFKRKKRLKLISYEKMTKKYYDCYDESIKKINDSNSNHKRKDIINV